MTTCESPIKDLKNYKYEKINNLKGSEIMNNKPTPYSILKIFAHPEKIQSIKNGERTAPIYIRIKPTNVCNHGCNYCHYGKGMYLDLKEERNNDSIPWDRMETIINDIADIGVKAVTFSGGGEPLMYPKIVETMKLVKERGIDLSIITNGSRLNDERAEVLKDAKWVRISLDAAKRETYAKIRSIALDSYEKLCDNIKQFAKIKNEKCELGVNFVVSHENYNEVYDVAVLMKSLGVNHIKYAARITTDVKEYHKDFKDNVIEQINMAKKLQSDGFRIISLYEDDFHLSSSFDRPYDKCIIKEAVCVIAADSKMYYCHDKAYMQNGIIGDLGKQSFKEIWFNEETINRAKYFNPKVECKHHCVYDTRNIMLNSFFDLDDNHINFI